MGNPGGSNIFFLFNEHEGLKALISAAQDGDDAAREKIIEENQNFIKRVVLKNVTGYEDIHSRDEYSVGLIAFNEAISSYKPGLRSFQSFAADVIKKRLVDYHRAQFRHKNRTVYIEDNPSVEMIPEQQAAEEKLQVEMEIESFINNLCKYGISMQDLISGTPKHSDSKSLCLRIARTIVEEEELADHFIKYGTIPLKQVLQRISINPKTVERNRRYIIAICLVLLSDLDTMKGYVMSLDGGDDNHA
ncbi:MAG: hypothetical protein ACM3PP_00190 [Candidatus Saccharibacteria bacterium]